MPYLSSFPERRVGRYHVPRRTSPTSSATQTDEAETVYVNRGQVPLRTGGMMEVVAAAMEAVATSEHVCASEDA